MSLTGFLIGTDDFRKQVAEYNRLKITQSYKGVASLLLLVIAFLSIVLAIFAEVVLVAEIFLLPLAFFVYRGHKWAVLSAMILVTLITMDKGIKISKIESGVIGILILLIWWAFCIKNLYGTWIVEKERIGDSK